MEKSYDGGVAVDGPISTPVSLADISNIHIALGPILDVLRVCRDIHSDARGFLHVTNMSSEDRPVTHSTSGCLQDESTQKMMS